MPYVPLNLNVYTAAFAGAIAGAGVPSGAFIIDPVSGDYAPVANVAAVFAQAVDTAWGATVANQYDVDAIEEVCTNILTKGAGAPMTGIITTQGNWTTVATAIVALVRAGDTKATADGVVFPAVGGSGNGLIYQTLFVDQVNGLAVGADGSINRPFQTIPAAITYAGTQAWTAVELLIAPGLAAYGAAVSIPLGLTTIFHGWDDTGLNPPNLAGAITIVGGVGSTTNVGFINCNISAASITAADPLTQDISLSFDNTFNSATINAFNTILQYHQSVQGGDITSTGTVSIRWDGPSWAYFLQVVPTIPATTNHLFFDAGHDVYTQALAINGLAIGATGFVALTTPVYTNQRARVQVQVTDPSVQDFICGVHGVGVAGTITLWITNLSRVSTNFNESVLLLVHQEQMVSEPPP